MMTAAERAQFDEQLRALKEACELGLLARVRGRVVDVRFEELAPRPGGAALFSPGCGRAAVRIAAGQREVRVLTASALEPHLSHGAAVSGGGAQFAGDDGLRGGLRRGQSNRLRAGVCYLQSVSHHGEKTGALRARTRGDRLASNEMTTRRAARAIRSASHLLRRRSWLRRKKASAGSPA